MKHPFKKLFDLLCILPVLAALLLSFTLFRCEKILHSGPLGPPSANIAAPGRAHSIFIRMLYSSYRSNVTQFTT